MITKKCQQSTTMPTWFGIVRLFVPEIDIAAWWNQFWVEKLNVWRFIYNFGVLFLSSAALFRSILLIFSCTVSKTVLIAWMLMIHSSIVIQTIFRGWYLIRFYCNKSILNRSNCFLIEAKQSLLKQYKEVIIVFRLL